jgi:hypothetical protein
MPTLSLDLGYADDFTLGVECTFLSSSQRQDLGRIKHGWDKVKPRDNAQINCEEDKIK